MKKINFYVGKKNIITFVVASIVLLYAMYAFFDNVLYFFSSSEPIDLGNALELNEEAFAKVENGDFVQIKGITSSYGGNVKKGLVGTKHIIYYFSGSPKFIIDSLAEDSAFEGPHYRTVKGRAFSFNENSRAAKMLDFFENSLYMEMDHGGFFIEDGVVPRSDYTGVFMFFLFLVLMMLNIFFFIRPIKQETKSDLMDLNRELDEL